MRRLWNQPGTEEALRLRKPRKLGPKPGVSANSCVQQPARFKNDVWTCDFIHDRTAEGGSLKWLTLVDEYTRECLVLHAAGSLKGADVRRIMAQVIGRRGAPTRIRSDNGSEFVCEALVGWLPEVGAKPIPVAAASPWENAYIESFHSRLRDEFLERVEFEISPGCSGEREVVPSGIQHGPTAQFVGLRDAERIQLRPATKGGTGSQVH